MSGIGGSGSGISGYGSNPAALSRIVEHLQSKGMSISLNGQENLNQNSITSQAVAGVGVVAQSFESFLKI